MKKTMKKTVCILLFLTLSACTAFLAYLHFFASDDRELSGEWAASLDMTGQAAARALDWLQDIEAVSISLEDMEAYMQDLTIQMDLTLEQTARFEGTFRCAVQPESYEACSQAAYEALAAAFRDLLAQRLYMAGYTGGTDEENIEELVTETFGMPTVSYLMSCGPALLPSLEELQEQYDGSGIYKAEEGTLTRQFDDGSPITIRKESYIRKGSTLILFEENGSAQAGFLSDPYPIIYTLKHMPYKQ